MSIKIARRSGDPYAFTSPLDNRLDRATYFKRCWPNSETTTAMTVVAGTEDGDLCWIAYEGTSGSKRFRNCEMHRVRNGRIVETEVYFGWNVPHEAPEGRFVEDGVRQACSSTTNKTMKGGCLCGQLRFRIKGPVLAVNACHCHDCQRLTGSAFAVNAMVETTDLEPLGTPWSKDDFTGQKPDERRWRCSECGVLLYVEHRAFGERMLFVGVGTLDDGHLLEPDAHYFVRSKHPWVAIPTGVPSYETLPPKR